jgi:hypothetical protein
MKSEYTFYYSSISVATYPDRFGKGYSGSFMFCLARMKANLLT